MNTVVLNEDEARSLLIFINYRIENETMEEMANDKNECIEVVGDG